jgi:hypothetical protein
MTTTGSSWEAVSMLGGPAEREVGVVMHLSNKRHRLVPGLNDRDQILPSMVAGG